MDEELGLMLAVYHMRPKMEGELNAKPGFNRYITHATRGFDLQFPAWRLGGYSQIP